MIRRLTAKITHLLSLARSPHLKTLVRRRIAVGVKSVTGPEHMRKILSVEGSTDPAECQLLHELAGAVVSGCVVEIGSHRGRATTALALGSKSGRGVPVFAVEPHEDYVGPVGGVFGPADRVAFMSNMLRLKVADLVHLVNLRSEEVARGWTRPIGLLWIDGDHSYDGVKRDFESWRQYVIPGGLIAFHDSTDRAIGPMAVIEEAVATGDYEVVSRAGTLTVLKSTAGEPVPG